MDPPVRWDKAPVSEEPIVSEEVDMAEEEGPADKFGLMVVPPLSFTQADEEHTASYT